MITVKEAKKIADDVLEQINSCDEFEKAYVFMSKLGENTLGGDYSPVAVLKDDGRIQYGAVVLIMDGSLGELIKENVEFS